MHALFRETFSLAKACISFDNLVVNYMGSESQNEHVKYLYFVYVKIYCKEEKMVYSIK